MKFHHIAAAAALIASPQLVSAQRYISTFTGTVDRIGSLSAYGSDGRIEAASPVTIKLKYDVTGATPIPQGSGNIFVVPMEYSFKFGDYSRKGQSGAVYIGIYNDRVISTGDALDSGAFSFIGETGNVSDQPFSIGSGPTYSALNIFFNDFDGTTLDGADIGQLLKIGSFPSVRAELGFYNASTATGVTAFTNRLTASTFAVGVPEPATWAMMIIGFGAIGGAMRRRRVNRTWTTIIPTMTARSAMAKSI